MGMNDRRTLLRIAYIKLSDMPDSKDQKEVTGEEG